MKCIHCGKEMHGSKCPICHFNVGDKSFVGLFQFNKKDTDMIASMLIAEGIQPVISSKVEQTNTFSPKTQNKLSDRAAKKAPKMVWIASALVVCMLFAGVFFYPPIAPNNSDNGLEPPVEVSSTDANRMKTSRDNIDANTRDVPVVLSPIENNSLDNLNQQLSMNNAKPVNGTAPASENEKNAENQTNVESPDEAVLSRTETTDNTQTDAPPMCDPKDDPYYQGNAGIAAGPNDTDGPGEYQPYDPSSAGIAAEPNDTDGPGDFQASDLSVGTTVNEGIAEPF